MRFDFLVCEPYILGNRKHFGVTYLTHQEIITQ